jgi:hypothetical protein
MMLASQNPALEARNNSETMGMLEGTDHSGTTGRRPSVRFYAGLGLGL